MRLHGYCTRCHRFRLVNVHGAPLPPVPTGTCDECDDAAATPVPRRIPHVRPTPKGRRHG